MSSDIKVSFIIPCFNEVEIIADTIKKVIEEAESNGLNYEIVVSDNMSSDGSVEEVRRLNIEPVLSSGSTVAQVRNDGFRKSTGELLVFLDSDVFLGNLWGSNFLKTIDQVARNKRLITGSHCSVPENLNQPFLSWYKGIEKDSRNTHLGTGHLIMHRDLFEDVGMFNGVMESGEDYDFCQRARQKGAIIHHDDNLKVYHMGYPDGMRAFIRREAWHGASDFTSVRSFLESKVAIVSMAFFFAHIAMLVSLLTGSSMIFVISFSLLVSLLFISVLKKFEYINVLDFLYKISVSYLYFWGRFFSAVRLLTSKRI